MPLRRGNIASLSNADTDRPTSNCDQIDRVIAGLGGDGRVDDVYLLSPMQKSMLFHGIQESESSVYVVTLMCRLRGELNADVFERAWQYLVAHHGILRTAFLGSDTPTDFQAVLHQADFHLERHDWTRSPTNERDARMKSLLEQNRQRPFDLLKPPLMRVALVRTGQHEHQMIWTMHHVLLDGWSGASLMKELFSTYQMLEGGRVPEQDELFPFKGYISWLQRQDLRAAQEYWMERLAGFVTPKPFARTDGSEVDRGDSYRDHDFRFPIGAADLEGFARRHRLTVGTVLQGAWALVLGRCFNRRDVIFGVTISGRPGDLEGIERTAGLFINTLPLRITMEPYLLVKDWLHLVHGRQAELQDFGYSPLSQVQEWSPLPSDAPLFESLLVFENYPIGISNTTEMAEIINIDEVASIERTHYPLTIQIFPRDNMSARLTYNKKHFDEASLRRIAEDFSSILQLIVTCPSMTLSALLEAETID